MKSFHLELQQKIILVLGKGGVGKSTLSAALSQSLAKAGKKILLVRMKDSDDPQTIKEVMKNLFEIELTSHECFQEYVALKLKIKSFYTLLLGSKLIQYLEKAAPGVKEIVLLGKIWHERKHYDHVIVDMPSTGHALAMIHTPFNFAELFPGGPIHQDAMEMSQTLADPKQTAFLVVSLPEEMPMQEGMELCLDLATILPLNQPRFIVNRVLEITPDTEILHRRLALNSAIQENMSWKAFNFQYRKASNQKATQERFSHQLNGLIKTKIEIPEITASTDSQRSAELSTHFLTGGQ